MGDVVVLDVRDSDVVVAVAMALRGIAERAAAVSQLLIGTPLDALDATLAISPEADDLIVGSDDVELHLALAAVLGRARDRTRAEAMWRAKKACACSVWLTRLRASPGRR